MHCQAQSGETRRRILDAARALIVERGYRAATVAEIAGRGDVHVDMVYALVRRKPVVLRELVEQALSGADRSVAAEERDYVEAIRTEPEPSRKLAIYARATLESERRNCARHVVQMSCSRRGSG